MQSRIAGRNNAQSHAGRWVDGTDAPNTASHTTELKSIANVVVAKLVRVARSGEYEVFNGLSDETDIKQRLEARCRFDIDDLIVFGHHR